MHEQLKAMLLDTEVVWIYDEVHRCAIIRQPFKNGRTLYCLMHYNNAKWIAIDIEETDIHGAQLMYECFVSVMRMCAPEA